MLYIVFMVIGVILFFLYTRYVPVKGIQCVSSLNTDDHVKVLDVRDYNDSYRDSIPGAINIPIAYLKKYYHCVGNSDIIIVASNNLEKNMSIRFLRKKGCNIIGYTLTNCNCNQGIGQKIA